MEGGLCNCYKIFLSVASFNAIVIVNDFVAADIVTDKGLVWSTVAYSSTSIVVTRSEV